MKIKYNNIEISISVNQNAKLGVIPSINLPPVVTCRKNAPCVRECYARRGRWTFPNVRKSLADNLTAYETAPADFFAALRVFLRGGIIQYSVFRYFGAGDIPAADFFARAIDLARDLPDVRFLMFTKKYEIVNSYIDDHGGSLCAALPDNLAVVLSSWGDWMPDNPYNLPISCVDIPGAEVPAVAIPCGGSCASCLGCWSLKNGGAVVFKKH